MRRGESLVTMPKGRSANSISLIHWGYFLRSPISLTTCHYMP